jgi:hypothetical protein
MFVHPRLAKDSAKLSVQLSGAMSKGSVGFAHYFRFFDLGFLIAGLLVPGEAKAGFRRLRKPSPFAISKPARIPFTLR